MVTRDVCPLLVKRGILNKTVYLYLLLIPTKMKVKEI